MHLSKQVVQPPTVDYTPPRKSTRYHSKKSLLSSCPSCGGLKRSHAKRCRNCKYAETRPPIDQNVYVVEDVECRRIPLCSPDKSTYAWVDASDYEYLMQWQWHLTKHKHARTQYAEAHIKIDRKRTTTTMHRILLRLTDLSTETDHINHSGIDNRRKNLRVCSHINGSRYRQLRRDSKSGFTGVSLHRGSNKWRCAYTVNTLTVSLGLYDAPEEAGKVRDAAAIFAGFKSFTVLNFPDDIPVELSAKFKRRISEALHRTSAT